MRALCKKQYTHKKYANHTFQLLIIDFISIIMILTFIIQLLGFIKIVDILDIKLINQMN